MLTLEEEIRTVRRLRLEADRLKREADEADRAFKIAQEKLWERMDATGVGTTTIDGVQYTPRVTIYGTVADKAAFSDWAAEHEPELLEPAPRKALINEMVRQRLDNNEPLPPGVNWYDRKRVSQTGGKDDQ